LFEFNMNGKELDAYVKQQVEAYRLQAKSFGLAK
ncbi:tricarboxylic transporter, partial [Klebsiella michiganensis]